MSALDIFERYTTVDHEFDSSDVAAFVTGKINRGPSDIPGLAAESHRNLPVACAPHFLNVASSVAFGEAGVFSTIGVFISPGKIAFTLIRLLACSTAVVLVS